MSRLGKLIAEAAACRICAPHLPHEPRPVFRIHARSRVLVVGQAPGTKVHASGIPWNDASGKRLREWMGVDDDSFYDARRFAIVPMGFCYPGKGRSGDLPPRPECRATWHDTMIPLLKDIQLVLAIGQYAQDYLLGERRGATLTETVRGFRDYAPGTIPLPHPSPRNQLWLSRNPWFAREVLPYLRKRVREALK
ncbi:MAG: uracil-DNA glycosylase family protein [Spirochaetales bacterium]|nr:uracil-DNA glycosylase family protein [Leptospiraceae bacterium]MCP5481571.1 uracil-DNA glycosylase family protein [Spirochaetales bacterium]MCP5484399.1 uracil-DNA glycosylase family protein [Spirochaetales bacterium]